MTAAWPDWNTGLRLEETPGPTRTRNILLTVDENEKSRVAIPVGRRLAELYGAVVHVSYVGERRIEPKEMPSALGFTPEESRTFVFEPAQQSRDRLARPTRELTDVLLVLSTALGLKEQSNRFGSITESVFATRPQRAVLVNPERGEKPWNLRRILLAHDGTPVSNPATQFAADLAQRAKAEVIAVHVAARGQDRPDAPGSIAAPLYIDQPQHEWPGWAEEFMNRIAASGALDAGAKFKLKVIAGQAGSELAGAARGQNIDLVIMAWHGHWTDHEYCATRVVVRNAGCPVMLVCSNAGD
jgi:nucleotide-binding universal stress UspA family protein